MTITHITHTANTKPSWPLHNTSEPKKWRSHTLRHEHITHRCTVVSKGQLHTLTHEHALNTRQPQQPHEHQNNSDYSQKHNLTMIIPWPTSHYLVIKFCIHFTYRRAKVVQCPPSSLTWLMDMVWHSFRDQMAQKHNITTLAKENMWPKWTKYQLLRVARFPT